MTDNFCTVHHPNYVKARPGCSKVGCRFIDRIIAELGLRLQDVQHVHYDVILKDAKGSEYKIPGTDYRFDGFTTLPNNQDVIRTKLRALGIRGDKLGAEFMGNVWHGNPEIYDADDISFFGARFGDLYDQTIARRDFLRSHCRDVTVIYIWENRFFEWEKQALNSLLSYCEIVNPLEASESKQEDD